MPSKPANTKNESHAKTKEPAAANQNTAPVMMDPMELGRILATVYDRARPMLEDVYNKYGKDVGDKPLDPLNLREVYLEFMTSVSRNPKKYWDLQIEYWNEWMGLWSQSMSRFLGEAQKDGEAAISYEPEKGDRRFRAKEWQDSAIFDFLKQSYLMTGKWVSKTVNSADDLDPATRKKLDFFSRQFIDALSPTNFVLTNPEVLQTTLETGGENLIRGLENLVADIERGKGELKIRTTDYEAFELGKNIAVTPGHVIYQNDLMQLIQYTPTTENHFKRPLLLVPPWINKYYILDLRPDNSFIKWLVAQGHTVFTISWVNPDKDLARKSFGSYMTEGILEAMDVVRDITGEPDCNVIGYCLGGTLLATTLSWLQAKGQSDRIASATFLTTLLDFEESGDLKLFADPAQIEAIEMEMTETGYFAAKNLQRTFSMLRSNDLIWSFVVNNYLMGKEPFPFDLLFWNDDSTNMPAAMHSYYLRNMYLKNRLKDPGGLEVEGVKIDLTKIETPSYFLSTREDHIAPWKATYAGTQLLKGKSVFTLAASGHIAGVVNHPDAKKYCYWTSEQNPSDPESWNAQAEQKEGSWWPHWQGWVKDFGHGKVKARQPGTTSKYKKIEAAPGSYVKRKAAE